MRKMDFYFGNHPEMFTTQRYMSFNDEPMKAKMMSKFSPEHPLECSKMMGQDLWSRFKQKLFETDKLKLKEMQRQFLMTD